MENDYNQHENTEFFTTSEGTETNESAPRKNKTKTGTKAAAAVSGVAGVAGGVAVGVATHSQAKAASKSPKLSDSDEKDDAETDKPAEDKEQKSTETQQVEDTEKQTASDVNTEKEGTRGETHQTHNSGDASHGTTHGGDSRGHSGNNESLMPDGDDLKNARITDHQVLDLDDGTQAEVVTMEYNGTEVVVADLDRDGTIDLIGVDRDGDGHLSDNEIVDMRGSGQRLDELPGYYDGDDENHLSSAAQRQIVTLEDGSQIEVAMANVDGSDMYVADVDMDGKIDFAASDVNGNGEIDADEIVDLTDYDYSVDQFVADANKANGVVGDTDFDDNNNLTDNVERNNMILEDGTEIEMASANIDGTDVVVADLDLDGNIDIAMADLNGNGEFDDDEIVDLTGQNYSMDAFVAEASGATAQSGDDDVVLAEHVPDVVTVERSVTLDEQGNMADVAVLSVDGMDAIVADVDMDGTIDIVAVDVNSNGSLEDDEIRMVSEYGVSMDEIAGPLDDSHLASTDDDYINDAAVDDFYV